MGGCASQAGAFAEDDSLMVLDAAQQWRPARLVEVHQGGGPSKKKLTFIVEFIDEGASSKRLTISDPDIPQRVRRLRRASEGDAGIVSKLAQNAEMPAATASSSSLSPATDHDDDDGAEVASGSGAPAAGSSDGGEPRSSSSSSRDGDDADSESAAGMSSRSRQRRRQGMQRRGLEPAAAAAGAGLDGSPGSPATTISSRSSRGRSSREASFDLATMPPRPAIQVLCLETFQTKSGRRASRWRLAHIVSWNQGAITAEAAAGGAAAAKARISYDGWSSRHDVTLSMATEWPRLALRGSLTDEEMAAGLPLSGAALESSRRAFSPQTAPAAAGGGRTGPGSAPLVKANSGGLKDLEVSQTPSADAWRWEGRGRSSLGSTASSNGGNDGSGGGNGSMAGSSGRRRASSRSLAAAEAAAPPLPSSAFKPGHVFRKGDTVDCLDFFQSAKTNQRTSRWRPAEVVAVEELADESGPSGRRLRIHFHNWADKWDIWLDANTERDLRRLAPPFTRARVASEQLQNNAADKRSIMRNDGRNGSSGRSRSASLAATYPQSANGVAEDSQRHPNSFGPGAAPAAMEAAAARERRAASGQRQDPRRRSGGGGYASHGGVPMRYPGRDEADDGSLSDGAFCDALRRRGLEILEVEPDGNCLFRAVGHQIYGDPEMHNEVRRACADHMARHHARFSTFVAEEEFHEYLRRVRQPCVWGDDLEIRALEEVYDRPIHIYAPHAEGFGPMKIDFDAGAGGDPDASRGGNSNGSGSGSGVPADVAAITLSYHGQSHYNSVLDRRHRYPLKPRTTQAILSLRIAQHASGPGPPAAAAAVASAAAAPGVPLLRSGRSMAGGGRTGEQSSLARRWAGLTRTSSA